MVIPEQYILLIAIALPVATIVAVAILIYSYVKYKVRSLPANRPKKYKNSERKKVVCIGDSITQGTQSYDYVSYLSQRLPNFDFINAGIRRGFAWNMLQSLDPVIKLQPDFITILVGSYEIDATLSHKNLKKYKKKNKLPETPSPAWFRENLGQIIQKLQAETTARIALFSPPLLGENLEEESNYWSAKYSDIIKKVAGEYGVAYLPLNERERELHQSLEHMYPRDYKQGGRLFRRSAFRHYVLGKSWDEISERNGFLLTPDLFHKNSKGGKIIVHLIERFLLRVEETQVAEI